LRKNPIIPVSWGELIDKVTILEIKKDRITSPTTSVQNVIRELEALLAVLMKEDKMPSELASLKTELSPYGRSRTS
jgi:hypothetical protein